MAEAIGLNPIYVKVRIFSRAFEDECKETRHQIFNLILAGSSPAVLANSIKN